MELSIFAYIKMQNFISIHFYQVESANLWFSPFLSQRILKPPMPSIIIKQHMTEFDFPLRALSAGSSGSCLQLCNSSTCYQHTQSQFSCNTRSSVCSHPTVPYLKIDHTTRMISSLVLQLCTCRLAQASPFSAFQWFWE